MIQKWVYGGSSDKLAYFSNGVVRFATLDVGYSVDEARAALLVSDDVRTDVRFRPDRPILWHDDDRESIAEFYVNQVETIHFECVKRVMGDDVFKYLFYIIEYIEVLLVRLNLRPIEEAVFLGQESRVSARERNKILAEWTAQSNTWLNLLGATQAISRRAQIDIESASDTTEMQSIVDGLRPAFDALLQEIGV